MILSGLTLLILGLLKLIPAIALLHSDDIKEQAETDTIMSIAMFFLIIDSTLEVVIGASLILINK